MQRQFLDASKIRDELGWVPRWDLDSGLEETYSWYERNLGRMPAVAAAPAP
jgi:dTDP-glucose 4,6-dehydratase